MLSPLTTPFTEGVKGGAYAPLAPHEQSLLEEEGD